MIRHKGTDYSCVAYILRSLLGPSFELMERYVLPTVWGFLSTSPIGDGLISVCSFDLLVLPWWLFPFERLFDKKKYKVLALLTHTIIIYTHNKF